MKTNPNDPTQSFPKGINLQGKILVDGIGLTKREYFAAMALAGLCPMCIPGSHNTLGQMVKELPEKAVALADALIEELNK